MNIKYACRILWEGNELMLKNYLFIICKVVLSKFLLNLMILNYQER